MLLSAGALAGRGTLTLPIAIAVGTAATLLADLIWFAVGRLRGNRALSLLTRIALDPDSTIRRAKERFVAHRARLLIVATFLPGLNPLAAGLAGTVRLDPVTFLLCETTGALLWAGGWMTGGYLAADFLRALATRAMLIGKPLLVLVAIVFGAWLVFKWAVRRRFLRHLRAVRMSQRPRARCCCRTTRRGRVEAMPPTDDQLIPERVRVASLLPSATEIVCAVGAEEDLVGISHECDFPESIRHLPALTRPRLRPVTGSGAIDREVRGVLQQALAVYEIELSQLEQARPDVIVTQDLCDVCAVSFDDVCAATAALVHRPARIVGLHPTSLDDIWADVGRVAEALGRSAEGARIVNALRERMVAIGERSRGCGRAPRVLTVEWLDPVMIAGMWMPELIELAGGIPLVTRAGEHAPTLTREALLAFDPDVVLVTPCGFPLERTLAEVPLLRASLPWDTWPAARGGRVYAADGNAFFNRPGPRIVESLEILAACLHPEAFGDFREEHREAVTRVDADLRQDRFDAVTGF